MNRKILIAAVLGLGTFGLLVASVAFIKSMSMSAKAIADLPRIDISSLENGQYGVFDLGKEYFGHKLSLFIYKKHNGALKVFQVPSKNGMVAMPDISWWRPFYECKKFGPSIKNGVVDESLPIKCHDKNLPSKWWGNEWRWSIEGENLGKMVEDLRTVSGTVEGKYYVYKQSS